MRIRTSQNLRFIVYVAVGPQSPIKDSQYLGKNIHTPASTAPDTTSLFSFPAPQNKGANAL